MSRNVLDRRKSSLGVRVCFMSCVNRLFTYPSYFGHTDRRKGKKRDWTKHWIYASFIVESAFAAAKTFKTINTAVFPPNLASHMFGFAADVLLGVQVSIIVTIIRSRSK